jgi:Dolichyl-phosphate-mannose-protein mannosyltransferase
MTVVLKAPNVRVETATTEQRLTAFDRSWVTIATAVVVIIAVVGGLILRFWVVFHLTSSADEGMVGMVAQAALHAHFQAFLGGQAYGGTAEPYLIALAFLVLGQTAVTAELAEVALAAIAALIVWRIVLRLHPDGRVAWLAAAFAWCAPTVTVVDSTFAEGFRGVALICGLLLLLIALRVFDRGPHLVDLGAFGLMVGIGWWSTPEIVYFVLPASIILIMAMKRSPAPRWRVWSLPVMSGVVAVGVGALPWIWANIRSGLASLRTSGPYTVPLTYGGRLADFFRYGLAMDFGLIRVDDGLRFTGAAQPFLYGAAVVILGSALVLCSARGGRCAALVVAVVAYPFLYAIPPSAWDWKDGRYGNYLIPILAIVVTLGTVEAGRRLRLAAGFPLLMLSSVVLLVFGLSVYGLNQWADLVHTHLSGSWGDPDDPTLRIVHQLERSGVQSGYADYWVAYKLDFYGRGSLAFTTAGYEIDRSPTINSEVHRSSHPAWLFVPIMWASRDNTQFSAPKLTVGPDTVTEAQFKQTLHRLGIPYRQVNTDLLTAIIPARRLTPFEAGLPGSPPP